MSEFFKKHLINNILSSFISSIFLSLLISFLTTIFEKRHAIQFNFEEIIQSSYAKTPYFTLVVLSLVIAYKCLQWVLDKHERAALADNAGLNVYLKNSNEYEKKIIEKKISKDLGGVRDIKILAATGLNSFGNKESFLFKAVKKCQGEVSVILFNPKENNEFLKKRAKALGMNVQDYRKEIIKTVETLKNFESQGKKIKLYFYEGPLLWRIYLSHKNVWIQYYSTFEHVDDMALYGFKCNLPISDCSFFTFLSDLFDQKKIESEEIDIVNWTETDNQSNSLEEKYNILERKISHNNISEQKLDEIIDILSN